MPTLNIVVLNKLAERHITVIKNIVPLCNIITAEPEEAVAYMPNCDILVTWGWMDIRPLLSNAPNLKWIHALSAGVENLITPEIQATSAILTNSKGIHGIPVSEHVLAIMLAFNRGLNFFIRHQMTKDWKRAHVDEIHAKTIGIVGLGSIGREIAKKAKGLGMDVVAVKKQQTTELFVNKLYPPEDLNEMLAVSDFVVAALPLLPETKEYFKLEQFSAMRKSAYFINIARGAIICEADLITALNDGLIMGAGLDVFEHEPLGEDSPLWTMPNVIITPHVAALSPMYLDRAVKVFSDNLGKFAQNGEMYNFVDKIKGY
ncbi:Glyoxylate/hydroxypyruvate reductase B [bioreactor metagenome]|uniref:Glyoxylate/hydroxypyruvate reductase B n=1 Tax=bioreactor metagenome TaxID=1076179 RepID=A0A644TFM0_9ZZZZ|nr:D-2-hydroxyacid dehydrogenase [Negativicutes bacterium]